MHPQRVTVLASSNRTFLRMRLVKQQLLMVLDMITQFFLPKLDDIDVADMWLQQDDASQWNDSIIQKWDISWSCTFSFRWSELAS